MSQLGMENEGDLDTYRGASEASRTRGTRLTTISLEEKEANWKDVVTLGKVTSGKGRDRGRDTKRRQGRGPSVGLNRCVYTYGGATGSGGTSRAAGTSFTLRGRDKRLVVSATPNAPGRGAQESLPSGSLGH